MGASDFGANMSYQLISARFRVIYMVNATKNQQAVEIHALVFEDHMTEAPPLKPLLLALKNANRSKIVVREVVFVGQDV